MANCWCVCVCVCVFLKGSKSALCEVEQPRSYRKKIENKKKSQQAALATPKRNSKHHTLWNITSSEYKNVAPSNFSLSSYLCFTATPTSARYLDGPRG